MCEVLRKRDERLLAENNAKRDAERDALLAENNAKRDAERDALLAERDAEIVALKEQIRLLQAAN